MQGDRLWRERAVTYVAVVAWANDVNAWALRRRGRPGEPLPDSPALLSRDLHARVVAFAGSDVLDSVNRLEASLNVSNVGDTQIDAGTHWAADALIDAIQQELRHERPRSPSQKRRLGIGQWSQQDLTFGAGPQPRK